MEFYGYKRSDGRVGVRNHVLVLPTNICASDTAQMIASQVNGAVSFHNQVGCSQVPSDMAYALDMMAGFAANPVIGTLSNRLIEAGATVILSETTEFIGAESILFARAKDEQVKERISNIVNRYEEHFLRNGENVRRGNPTPGNQEGGLTTLEEKSLGCIHKGGDSVIQAVFDYGKQIEDVHGLVIMDTPGNDAASISGMLAGGAQIVVFSSGRGTPLGSPIAPVIKITGNADTYRIMKDNIDFDASPALDGRRSLENLGDELYQMLLDSCNGKQTKAEALGFVETAVMRACNYV